MSSVRRASTNPDRIAVRHGHEDGEVTLGGRRVEVERPRVRTADGEAEVRLATYEHFADRDPLAGRAGADARRRLDAPVPPHAGAGRRGGRAGARSTSKSAVSRTFVERTREALGELMGRRLARSAPGGDDDRRARAEGPHEDRRARDHDRGREDPARALGRKHRERDRRDRAAVRSGRARPGSRAGDAVRDRRLQGAAQSGALRVRRGPRAALPVAQGAKRDRAPPRARPPADQGAAARAWRETDYARALEQLRGSPTSSTARTPAPPARCAKGWRRRSRSSGSASAASSGARSSRRTRASR